MRYNLNEVDYGAKPELVPNLEIIDDSVPTPTFKDLVLEAIRRVRDDSVILFGDPSEEDMRKGKLFETLDGDGDERFWFLSSADEVHARIDLKYYSGPSRVLEKTFSNAKHLDNWIAAMERKGVKIIGVYLKQIR